MKIGIVTFTTGDNYGQRLQNYAVQTLLEAMGADVCTLQPRPPHQSVAHRIKIGVHDVVCGDWLVKRNRHRCFVNFDGKYIKYHPYCPSGNNAGGSFDDFDAYVAGSDQIWSPYISDPDGFMFLSFAGEAKRIALSASIAAPSIPEAKKKRYAEWLAAFDHISVREDNANALISDLIGKTVPVLIDPTLMFGANFWRTISCKPGCPIPSKFALKYFLGNAPEKESRFDAYCQSRQLPVLNLCGDKRLYASGPSEFLYLIEHASIVATDSFHGSIFSILFKKPLLIFDRAGSEYIMTDRFDTLAKKLGLGDWRTYNWDALSSGDPVVLDADFRLKRERKLFKDYINMAFATLGAEGDACA